MALHRALANYQLLGNQRVAESLRNQAQHFAFNPRGQKVQQQLIDDKIIES